MYLCLSAGSGLTEPSGVLRRSSDGRRQRGPLDPGFFWTPGPWSGPSSSGGKSVGHAESRRSPAPPSGFGADLDPQLKAESGPGSRRPSSPECDSAPSEVGPLRPEAGPSPPPLLPRWSEMVEEELYD